MPGLGYALSSEEHFPNDLVRYAAAAEETGFSFALISDHYHPWTDRQGQSAFVWSVIGGIAQATSRLRLGTGVTCPTIRIHPAIVAQAAATAAAMMPGRFFLGVGSGENLNEHILGDRWPFPDERIEMLAEAIEVIRLLWQGGYQTHRGRHYRVEKARIYTLPDELPPIAVAAAGPVAAELAGRAGDALVAVEPNEELVKEYERAGGKGPCYGQVTVCWAETEEEGVRTAREWWPNVAIPHSQDLALPSDFEDGAKNVDPEDVAEQIACGPDPERHLELIRKFEEAGFDHVYIHQVGPDQDGFFRFYREEILPML